MTIKRRRKAIIKKKYHSRVKIFHIYLLVMLILVISTIYTLLPFYHIQDYKGDEVWYVDAARNYLVHIGVYPTYEYTQESTYQPEIYYGVNVLINIPFWNRTSFNQQDMVSRVVSGDPNDAVVLLKELYSWKNKEYFDILKKALNSTNAGHVIYIQGLYKDLTNNAYFLVGGAPNRRESKMYVDNFISALSNIKAPHDIYITIHYIKPVNKDGTTVYVNKTMTFLVFKKGETMFKVVPGFRYADKWGIQYYYNFEHPFLGKAFIITSMYLLGDNPEAWRLPSMIAYIIILLSVAFVVLKLTKSYFWSIIGASLVAIDPGLRMMGSTAMLDIFVAMFTSLAMLAFVKRNLKLASVFIGLAGAVKLNGWFLALAIIIIVVLEIRQIETFKGKISYFLKRGTLYTTIAVFSFIVGMLPIELFFKFNEWWPSFVEGSLWMMHRSVPHPFQSPVWNWFFNKNPFTIYFYPRVMIQTNWFLWILTVIFSILGFFVVYDYRIKTEFNWINIGLWSLWIMWFVAYLIGSRAQYSYYDVQVTPFVIVVFTVSFANLLCWNELKESIVRSILADYFNHYSRTLNKKVRRLKRSSVGRQCTRLKRRHFLRNKLR